MMRTLFMLSACGANAQGIFTPNAQVQEAPKGECILNGAQTISDLMDAGVYTWAATNRCGIPGAQATVKCEIDVASAVESANRMVNVLLQAINQCGNINTINNACGVSAGVLTAKFAGIAAASGGIIEQCPNTIQQSTGMVMDDSKRAAGQSIQDPAFALGKPTSCLIDVKNSMSQLFQATQALNGAKRGCTDGGSKCAYTVVGIIDALAGLARFLMGAVGHCSHPGFHSPGNFPLACSESITRLLQGLSGFTVAAKDTAVKCGAPVPQMVAPAVPEVEPIYEPVDASGAPVGETIEGDAQPGLDTDPPAGVAAPARLYSVGEDIVRAANKKHAEERPATSSSNTVLNTALAALLPLTAVVSFVGGMKLRATQARDSEAEFLVEA